jgi:hypothetical protein
MISHGVAGVVGAILNATSVGDSGRNNNNNMKRLIKLQLTQILLSASIGMNFPREWFWSLSMWSRLWLVLTVGICVVAVTEWAYPKQSNNN